MALAQVPYSRLTKAEQESASWLTYSGSYRSHRYSLLDQVTRENVARLRPAWVYQLTSRSGQLETSPIVADGVMYITEPPSTVTALDRQKWGHSSFRFVRLSAPGAREVASSSTLIS